MKNNFEVVSIIDNDDGTANVVLEMDIETLKVFASIGLMEVFRAKAMEANGGYPDSEGADDETSGAGGDCPIRGELSGV